MSGTLVFISHSRIKAGKLQDFKAYAEHLMPRVQEREPRILAFNTYVDEAREHYTPV